MAKVRNFSSAACSVAGNIDIGVVFGLESVETPHDREPEVAVHLGRLHSVILPGEVDAHIRIAGVEDIVGLQVELATALASELPFNSGIYLPERAETPRPLYMTGHICGVDRQKNRDTLAAQA